MSEAPNTQKVSTTSLLRDELFDAIQKVKAGTMKPDAAQAVVGLAAQVLAISKLELDVAKFRGAMLPTSPPAREPKVSKAIDADREDLAAALIRTCITGSDPIPTDRMKALLPSKSDGEINQFIERIRDEFSQTPKTGLISANGDGTQKNGVHA